jgi:hypothetical protein
MTESDDVYFQGLDDEEEDAEDEAAPPELPGLDPVLPPPSEE